MKIVETALSAGSKKGGYYYGSSSKKSSTCKETSEKEIIFASFKKITPKNRVIFFCASYRFIWAFAVFSISLVTLPVSIGVLTGEFFCGLDYLF